MGLDLYTKCDICGGNAPIIFVNNVASAKFRIDLVAVEKTQSLNLCNDCASDFTMTFGNHVKNNIHIKLSQHNLQKVEEAEGIVEKPVKTPTPKKKSDSKRKNRCMVKILDQYKDNKLYSIAKSLHDDGVDGFIVSPLLRNSDIFKHLPDGDIDLKTFLTHITVNELESMPRFGSGRVQYYIELAKEQGVEIGSDVTNEDVVVNDNSEQVSVNALQQAKENIKLIYKECKSLGASHAVCCALGRYGNKDLYAYKNIYDVESFAKNMTDSDILRMPKVGTSIYMKIKCMLHDYGLELKPEDGKVTYDAYKRKNDKLLMNICKRKGYKPVDPEDFTPEELILHRYNWKATEGEVIF